MHMVGCCGQILRARTVTRLIKEQQLNSVEFSKIILPPYPPYESEPDYQEPQEESIALSFRNFSGHSSCSKNQK